MWHRPWGRRSRAEPTAPFTSRTTRSPRADAFVIAGALAAAIRDERFDLVLTGLQSDDQGFGQVGVVLAERLGRVSRDDHHGSAD